MNIWISVDECIPPEDERVITWDGYRVSIGMVESWFADLRGMYYEKIQFIGRNPSCRGTSL